MLHRFDLTLAERGRILILLLGVWALLWPHRSAAQASEASRPACTRTFSLAYHVHGLLYNPAEDRGIDKDVAEELIRRSGCQFRVTVMPRSRIWMWIESGELDFSMSGITNESRDKFAAFAWYLYNKYDFLVRNDAQVATLADFEQNPRLVLGKIRSFRYSQNANDLVDRLTQQGRVVEVRDHEQLLSMLKLNRIQGIIIEPFNYTQVDQKELLSLTHMVDLADPPVLHGLIMSKKSLPENEQQKWRGLIDDMHRDGTLLRIMSKYFSRKDAKAMVTF